MTIGYECWRFGANLMFSLPEHQIRSDVTFLMNVTNLVHADITHLFCRLSLMLCLLGNSTFPDD